MTKHTAKALSAESGAPSERTETQGDLWKEIAEEGYDSLDGAWETLAQRRKARETESATASTAPIIEDGKTLDELIAPNDAIGQHLLRTMRADGATDQEIWQFMVEN